MSDFVSPISCKNFKDISFSKGVIKTRLYDYAVSPYNGTIILSDDSSCVEIKHNYQNKTYFSKFCGLNKIKVNNGQKVSSGTVVGLTKDGKTEFSVKNSIGSDITNKMYSDTKTSEPTQKIKGKGKYTDPDYVLSKLKPSKPKIDFSDPESIERMLKPEEPKIDFSDPESIKKMVKPKPSVMSTIREDIQRIKNLMK
jgi:murein DD-endopeptidase MepM/ murein hydrolase activator NlpD